jgi:hypothetical protein
MGCCCSKTAVDPANEPIRPVRRRNPSLSQSYDEPDVYPQRTWHTHNQEAWTGVYGKDFDEMKKIFSEKGSWLGMKAEGKWDKMAAKMARDQARLPNNKKMADKWAKLEIEAKKNREREGKRVADHETRISRDPQYYTNYASAAHQAGRAKEKRLKDEKEKRVDEWRRNSMATSMMVQKMKDDAARKRAMEAKKKFEKEDKARKARLTRKGRLERRTV